MSKLRNRDKKSYPQFEGRIIRWTNPNLDNGKIFYGRIIGCDYSIGVTIVEDGNESHRLTCFNGPDSPAGKERLATMSSYQERYDINFKYFLDVMRSNGVYNAQERVDRCRLKGIRVTPTGNMSSCSFGV